MLRKPTDIVTAEITSSASAAEWFDLRSQILRWVLDNEFAPAQKTVGADRYQDNWSALLSVAETGDWAQKAGAAYRMLAESYLEDDLNAVLLAALKGIFDRRNAQFLTSRTLVGELNKDASASWYRISERTLAQFLRAFRVRPEQHRLGRDGIRGGGRGYWRSQLEQQAFIHI
jgi:hypothetical protein